MSNIVPSIKKRHIMALAESGKRIDGRGLTDMRKLEIRTNVLDKAEGSATVKLGDTYVIAGIKFEIGDPFPDIPNEGVISVNAEFLPLASPTFESGPPDERAIELARIVDRAFRGAKMINTQRLCIIPGKKVWIVWVDIFILDHCGNLIDASALASLCALMTTKMPRTEVIENEVKVLNEYVPLPISNLPITITLAKIGDKLFVDPSLDEEEVMDCRISVAFVEKNGQEHICAMQKGGPGILTPEELMRAVEIAKVKSQELRKIVLSGGE
ncbi:MAG: exosome complex protein Rrp42 [Candidatus Methanomethyliaceae archaeon]|nr:exosome complex protein Rrp42 [Candidatus Methanomethyliaceae archaeon]MDW7970697.1 exosome complex protein Rrp42 [Nitrososphaerota archaeon]